MPWERPYKRQKDKKKKKKKRGLQSKVTSGSGTTIVWKLLHSKEGGLRGAGGEGERSEQGAWSSGSQGWCLTAPSFITEDGSASEELSCPWGGAGARRTER